ncbi:MAG: hypothetical protein LQ347_006042 [Umbilicaria vellea]|nr:MAG: hypothetical protein LQ347_006042 [Umbilicaria vellea]
MEGYGISVDHRKRRRRRRRRAERPAISAQLILDEKSKGDMGTLSDDLCSDLFGHVPGDVPSENEVGNIGYVAIAPWAPLSPDLMEEASWTILPIQCQGDGFPEAERLPPSSILFPASSLALQSFAEALQGNPGIKGNGKSKLGVEIRVLDVEPLVLETIFVTVDGDALRKHVEVHEKFGGGFGISRTNGFQGKGKTMRDGVNGVAGRSSPHGQDDHLMSAIREALTSPRIVHQSDLLPLPLPSHPITHVPLPPATITLCEPISQGLLSVATRIIVHQIHQQGTHRDGASLPSRKALPRSTAEEEEDTANEQFFSSVEDEGLPHSASDQADGSAANSSDSEISDRGSGGLSDDSLEGMISLIAPSLPSQSSGISSVITAATPRAGGPKMNGIHSPGSVYSSYTATTARQRSAASGKLFKTEGLVQRVSDEILHPKPSSEEDEEARAFVGINTLVKLGCFSGDWVSIEATSAQSSGGNGMWDVTAFSDERETSPELRAVKIYGLPETSAANFSQYPKRKASIRQGSMYSIPPNRPAASVYLSPILLANLGQPSHVKLCPLSDVTPSNTALKPNLDKQKISSSSVPPVAKEVTLVRVSTPLTTDRALQAGLMAGLKQYFEHKRRIMRKGDLVGISIDIGASKTLSQPGGAADTEHDVEEMFATSSRDQLARPNAQGVAWFRIGQVVGTSSNDDQSALELDTWGGVSSIEPMTTRMVQAGSEQCKVPSTMSSTWEYYLGVRQTPRAPSSTGRSAQVLARIPRPFVTPLQRRLRELMAAATSPRAFHLDLKPIVILLHSTQRNIGKANVASRACSDLGLHIFPIDAYDILTEGGAGGGDVKTEAFLIAKAERAFSCGPKCTVLFVRHIEALTADRMIPALKEVVQDSRVVIATTTEIEKISEGVRSLFTHELELTAPDEGEREGVLRGILEDRGARLASDVDLAAIAIKTAALVAGDLVDVVDRALVARKERLEQLLAKSRDSSTPRDVLLRDVQVSGGEGARCLTKADFEIAVDAARKNFADAIGAPKIPNVGWDDVGGLTNVKDAVMETIQLPLERPELFAKGMKKRSGILFYGPPGTGKTLLAKAIATEFSLNFFSVKGPELLNMYIGESEANVRRVFQRARDARPCVVFFDELDSVAPKRGNQGDSGGVMDRIVSQLLAELDGMSDGDDSGGGVFVIGATNRPDLLDQALLRPGRFDKMLYLGVSDTHDKQLTIMEALTRKFSLHPDMSLRRVAESLPFTYTGADLYALCSDAMLKAVTRQASAVDAKIKALPRGPVSTAYFFDHLATAEDVAVMVTEEDFASAQRELVGSVSAKELDHYQHVRATFEGPKTQSTARNPASSTPPASATPLPPQVRRATGTDHLARATAKSRTSTKPKGKGKGKATQWDTDDDDDDDDAYITSNDYGSPSTNGAAGFGDVGADDEEELYG